MVLRHLCTALLGLLSFVSLAEAQMLGATMEAEWVYSSFGSTIENHTVVVGPGVGLPITTIVSDTKFDIDLGDDWVEFRFNTNANWTDSSFNGWLFRDGADNLPDVTGYSVDSYSTGISNAFGIVTGFNDNEFWADFGGVVVGGSGDWIRLKLETQSLGVPFCFGDTPAAGCPCGNLGGPGEGCANSTTLGGLLTASGTSLVSNDDLVLMGSNLPPGVPSLFFSGTAIVSPGALLGDGRRCAGGQITRLEIVFADAGGNASTSVGIASTLGASVGTQSVLQLWYRNPSGPCGTGFNLTGAIDFTWH